MNLDQLITLWKEFILEWETDISHVVILGDDKRKSIWKPELYDFMQWLSRKGEK